MGCARFLIVAKEIFTAQSLADSLRERGPFATCGTGVATIAEANSVAWTDTDLVLLDFSIGAAAVRELTARISANSERSRVVVFGVEEEAIGDVADLVEAGAAAYVPTRASLADLARISLLATEGLTSCSPRVAFEVFSRLSNLSNRHFASGWIRSVQLTTREFDILQLLAKNCNNKEVANRLCLSVPTVKNHVHRLLSKLGVRSRIEAVACWKDAQRRGSLDPSCTDRSIVRIGAPQ